MRHVCNVADELPVDADLRIVLAVKQAQHFPSLIVCQVWPFALQWTRFSLGVELFRIEKGKIFQIQAIMERPPYGMNAGWSAWEDGLSSRARDVAK